MRSRGLALATAVALLAGVSIASTASAYASAPRNVSAAASTSAAGTVDVDWDAPNAPSGLIGYTVVPRNSAGTELSALAESVPGSGTGPIAVDGLTDGTSYTFVVKARYDDGSVVASSASATAVPFNTPLAPIITQTTEGDASVTLTWTAPDSRGSAITGYTITATPGSATVTAEASDTSKAFTGLVNGTEYTFTMVATNLRGNSDRSTATTPVTPFTTPSAPAAPSVTAGDTTVTVTWTQLAAAASPPEDGGSAITGYTVNAYAATDVSAGQLADGATVVSSANAQPSDSSAVVTGLTNGTAYVFTVLGQNASGPGDESDPSTSATPQSTSAVAITNVSPTVGSTAGGLTVTITGTGLTNTTAVTFPNTCGSSPATIVGSSTSTSVTVTTPTGCSAGSSDVEVTAAAGTATSSGAFTFRAPPTVSSLSATEGSANGGTSVTLTGTNFVTGATSATLAGVAISPLTVTNSTTLSFRVPDLRSVQGAQLGSSDLIVTVAGTDPVTASGAFTYTAIDRNVAVGNIASSQFGADPIDVVISGDGIIGSITDPSSPAPVTFSAASDTAVCTPDSSQLNVVILGAGDCSFSVTVGASGLYSSGVANVSFSVERGTQTITFVDPPTSTVGVNRGEITITSRSSGNGTISLAVDAQSTSDCALTDNGDGSASVTFTTTGTCIIQASATETAQFDPAAETVTFNIDIVAPSAPTSLSLVVSDGGLSASWTAPGDNGGGTITDYAVQYRTGTTGDWLTFADGMSTETTATITGLTNGTAYNVRVAAVNSAGTGQFTSAVSGTPVGAPATPTDVAAVAGDSVATVSWSAPSNNGGVAITGYIVQYRVGRSGDWSTADDGSSTDTTVTLTRLTNATTYQVRVAAVNSAGTSAFSDPEVFRPISTPAQSVLDALPETLNVADSSPAPGASFVIELDGFDAFEWVVLTIQSDPQVIGTVQADGDGRVSATVTIPESIEEGVHSLSMLGTESGRGGRVSILVTSDPDAALQDEVFVALTPARIMDTRSGDMVGELDGSGSVRELQVTGAGGVPLSGVSAVALNVTAVSTETNDFGGFVTVFPCGTRPDASNLNFTSGMTIPNSVIAPVSDDGKVCFYVYGKAHLLADVSGYFVSGFEPLTPSRIMDTRSGSKVGELDGSGAVRELQVTGAGGVPSSGVSAVALNVTAVSTETNDFGGFVTVFPCGTRPDASNLNFTSGMTIPNSVIAPVSSDGKVCFYVYGKAHLLADVSGYFSSGFESLTPSRIMDTRSGDKVGGLDGSGSAYELQVTGAGGVPSSGVSAVALNVTAVSTETNDFGGFVTVFPCGTRPDASNLNFTTGMTIPNSVIAPVSDDGKVCFYVYGKAHLLADVSGYFTE